MEFKLEPDAKVDIQNEINYYNEQQKGLGKKFHSEVKHYFKAIKKNHSTKSATITFDVYH